MRPRRQFAIGDRRVNLDRAEVVGPDGATALTPNEVKVLAVLAARSGEVVDRDVLLCEALGYRHTVNTRAIDQAIWRLRRKLEPAPHEPRWLLSEANVGYRLDLDPPAPRALVGRAAELVRLSALLEAPRSEVVVVALPGSGRRTLVAAVAAARGWRVAWAGDAAELVGPDASRAVRCASTMPEGPAAVLRLGPLAPDEGRALLIRAVLAVRGATSLPEEEEPEATAAAARAGHHPATLRRMALDGVLHRLGKVEVPALPEIAAHVAALPSAVRDTLAHCAPFPDPFLASEVEASVGAEALWAAWRAGLLDGVERGDGERWLVVPPCVRAVAPPAADPPATRRFVHRTLTEAGPVALAVIHRFDEAARNRLLALSARIDAALALATEDDRRIAAPLWLARWITTDRLPEPLPEEAPPGDPAACLDVLRWAAAERVRSGSGAPHLRAAAARPGLSPELLGYVLRSQFTADPTDGRVVAALEALAAAHPEPPHLGAMHAARGVARIRAGDLAGGRADLVEALAQYGPTSSARFRILSDLSVEASMDGRADEALAWLDRADPTASAPSQEAVRRLMRVTALQTCGRLEESARELALVDLLGVRRWPYGLARALQLQLEGRPDEALVVAESVRIERRLPGDFAPALPLVLGWACVAQGHGDRALAAVAEVPEPWDAQFGPLLSLLRVAALARSSRVDAAVAARSALAALPAPSGQGWPVARAAVAALIADDPDAGRAVEASIAATGVTHLVARLALAALAAPQLGPASPEERGNRPE